MTNLCKRIKPKVASTPMTSQQIKMQSEVIRSSPLFDEDWYVRNHPELWGVDVDPAVHYLTEGSPRLNPSCYFCSEEYLYLNIDVYLANVNPLIHYEYYGRKQLRETSTVRSDARIWKHIDGAIACEKEFGRVSRRHARTAIVACFLSEGTIPQTLLYEIRGLRDVVDNIVLMGDCEILPSELDKLEGLVSTAIFKRHGQYDLGSYVRGLAYLRSHGLLDCDLADELVFINDSCLGPVVPFEESFETMSARSCDFWGGVSYHNSHYPEHISTFLIVFKRPVIDSFLLDRFMLGVYGRLDRDEVIYFYETRLTEYLYANGFEFSAVAWTDPKMNIHRTPITCLKTYRVPMVKTKALTGDSIEDVDELVRLMTEYAPELMQHVRVDTKSKYEANQLRMVSREEHVGTFVKKASAMLAKLAAGERLQVLFCTSSLASFTGYRLFCSLLDDGRFSVRVVVIPDMRLGDEMREKMQDSYDELVVAGIPSGRIVVAEDDRFGRWRDAFAGSDLVVHSSPRYEFSSFRYSPYYAVDRDYLPLVAFDESCGEAIDEREFSLDACAYMWKVWFPDSSLVERYCGLSICDGQNALVASPETAADALLSALACKDR